MRITVPTLALPAGRALTGTHRRLLLAVTLTLIAITAAAAPAAAAPRFGSGVSVARNYDGRLEVFASDFDGDIVHIWQRSGGGWSGWNPLPFSGKFALARPAVGRNADGRLEVFAQSGTQLYHNYQHTAGGGWSGWKAFGGSFLSGAFTRPVVASNAAGRLELFAVRGDGHLAHRWQLAGGGWSSWANHGGDFANSALPAVARNADGRLEIFLTDQSGRVQHKWQTAPNSGWSAWESLGGGVLHGNNEGPAVGVNSDGRLEVFATGTDRQLYHRWQNPSGGWSGWYSLGGFIGTPTVARNADGRLEVFSVHGNGARLGAQPANLVHAYQLPGGGWSTWSYLSQSHWTYQTPAVAMNADGRLEAFSQRFDGTYVDHAWQRQPNSGWSAFAALVEG